MVSAAADFGSRILGGQPKALYCDRVDRTAAWPDDHLGALMFAADAGTVGGGRYADGQWEVSTAGRATDPAVRMVTLHEIMHAELNDSTAWGGAIPRLCLAGQVCA